MKTKKSEKRVLIFQQRNWGKIIGRPLAKKLFEDGCKLAAFTSKRSVHELIVAQNDVRYELIINHDDILSNPSKFLGNRKISIKEIVDDLGIDSIWSLASSIRQYARSYQEKYYYSFRKSVPDEVIENYIKAVYLSIKEVFQKFNPEVIIAPNFVSLHHIMFNLYAKKRGVRMSALTDSKIAGIYIFAENYLENIGCFYNKVDKLNQGSVISPSNARAKEYILQLRKGGKVSDESKESKRVSLIKGINPLIRLRSHIMRMGTFSRCLSLAGIKKIKKELAPVRDILLWYKNGSQDYLESVPITTGYRPPKYIIRDYLCQKRYKRFAKKFKYHDLSKIGKFVYFPLQVQPETVIDVTAPYFSNQIETARLIAMSLPGDYTLVVKEHPAMIGVRTPSYLEKVARTVNVKLVDYRIPTNEIMKSADLIISPGGTTIFEAAILKKPAIQLGELGSTLKLPNVTRHTDLTTLDKIIIKKLQENLDTELYETKLLNYVSAAYDTGYEVDFPGVWTGSSTASEKERERLVDVYFNEVKR
ncbi:MAG: hypothetical protein AAB534_00130 [Patescibacteria group bacterium]